MIASPALAAWLADMNAQKRARDAIEDCGRHWSRQPLMTEVERQLSELPETTSEAVLDIARGFMDRIGDVDALMNDMLAASACDWFFRPPFLPMSSDIHTGLLLFSTPELMIALGVAGVDLLAAKKSGPRGATSISFTGVTTLFRYLKGGDATLSFWEAPPITGDFVAAEAGQARLVGRRRLADGDEIVVDGRSQAFIIEHAASDMVYLQALVQPGAAPLAAEYDSKTLAFIGATSTDEASSRIQLMVSLLRTMERDDALPLILEALDSPHFYTRWHIMRELLALDADAALPPLRRMAASDPHPEIRATARQTLQLFFDEQPAGATEMSNAAPD
jgi:hypothetical protein